MKQAVLSKKPSCMCVERTMWDSVELEIVVLTKNNNKSKFILIYEKMKHFCTWAQCGAPAKVDHCLLSVGTAWTQTLQKSTDHCQPMQFQQVCRDDGHPSWFCSPIPK